MLAGDNDPELEDEAPAGADVDEGGGETDQDGEDPSADAQEPDEPGEDEEGEAPESDEAEAEGESDSVGDGETESGAEAGSELDALRAEIQQIRAREDQLLALLGQRQEPPAAAPTTGRDLEQTRVAMAALKQLWTAEPGKEQEVLGRLDPHVRERVQAGQRRFADMQALLAADPAAWVEHVVYPALQPLLQREIAPIQRDREDAALRDFAARHSDLSGSQETWSRVAHLVVNEKVPPDYAAQLVRQEIERAKVNQTKAKVDQAARQQRALSQSRKAQASRKPNVAGRAKPDFRGATSLGDFIAAEQRAKKLDQ